MRVELKNFRLSELLARGDARTGEDDAIQYGDPKKLSVFAANPFRHGDDSITRRILCADGRIAGGEYGFPVEIVAEVEIVRCGSGSETFVKEEFRKQGVGLEFMASEGDVAESDAISIGCGIAQRYARLHKMFGYKIFNMPRMIALRKSRPVVEMYFKGFGGRIATTLFDVGLACWWRAVAAITCLQFRKLTVREVRPDDKAAIASISEMALSDGHRFMENHSPAWFVWHLTQSLHVEGPAKLYAVERSGALVAFFMTKRKFHRQASSRGFRNVMLGSVIEWGVAKDSASLQVPVVRAAILRLCREGVDAVEVATDDALLQRGLRRTLMMRVGESNVGIRIGGNSALAGIPGADLQSNWRLRPAMCDNGL